MVGRHAADAVGFLAGMLNLPRTWREEREIRQRPWRILEDLGLPAIAPGDRPANLAFGQQRLVEFARALATEPPLLLLDEPAAGLNIHETEELAELILTIRDRGVTMPGRGARHVPGHGHLRRDRGARPGPEDRRGHAARRSSGTRR